MSKRKKRAAPKKPVSLKPDDVTAVLERLQGYQGKFSSVTLEAPGIKVTANFEAKRERPRQQDSRPRTAIDSLSQTAPEFDFKYNGQQ